MPPNLNPNRDSEKPRMLWVTLRDAYLDRVISNRSSRAHVENVIRILDRFSACRKLYDSYIDEITQVDIQAYVSDRSAELWLPEKSKAEPAPLSSRTINNEIAVLNSIFKYAGPRVNAKHHRSNLGILKEPPYYERLEEFDPLPVDVSVDQLRDFLAACKLAKSPRPSVCDPERFWIAVLLLDSITALRREALLSVPKPPDSILLGKRVIPVPAQILKNKSGLVIPLGTREDVAMLLHSLPSKVGEPLLPWRRRNGRRLSLSHFNATMKKFQLEAGIPEKSALKTKHLRSTAATEILAEQFSTDTARKRLGHKSEDVILKHYAARSVTSADRKASDFLANRVMELISGFQPAQVLPMKMG